MNDLELRKLKRHYLSLLIPEYGKEESEQMFRILMEEYFQMDRVRMALNPELMLSEDQNLLLENAVKQLLLHKPLQYVLGHADFMEMSFVVNGNVLIPRPETEELVGRIIDNYKSMEKPKRIWDIGTGSGCIAISLAKAFPWAEVFAIDVSEKALKVASENASRNAAQVKFIHDDIFAPQSSVLNEKVDLIVSNPPYVRASEKIDMKDNVLNFEPATALFVPDEDPLVFYREILSLAKKHLNVSGEIWFEINEYMGNKMKALCLTQGFDKVLIEEDFRQKERFCIAQF